MANKEKKRIETPERLNRLVAGSSVKGNISVNSNIRIDGTIEGNVKCEGKLVLGEEGNIIGNIVAIEAEISGSVEGETKVEDLLVLTHSATIKGSLYSGRLVIEDGAKVDGNILTGVNALKNNSSNITIEEENSEVVY